MTSGRKFVISASSTTIIGISIAITHAIIRPDPFFPPGLVLIFGVVVFGLILAPIQLILTAILHATKIVSMDKVPVLFVISQSVILVGFISLVHIYVSELPPEIISPWADGQYHPVWYYEEPWLSIYGFLPWLLFTLIVGRIYHRIKN